MNIDENNLLQYLTPRERDFLKLRESNSLEEIGRMFGVSKETARTVINTAGQKLKSISERLSKHGIDL